MAQQRKRRKLPPPEEAQQPSQPQYEGTGFDPSTRHPQYDKWLYKWQRQRDVVEGEDAVKSSPRAEDYLPPLEGQGMTLAGGRFSNGVSVSSYEKYKDRACFTNATGRTRDGLIGAIMRKEPRVEWPEADKKDLDHIGYELESFNEIVIDTLNEVIGVGRFAHLVDVASFGTDVRPYIACYRGEAITDWELGLVKGFKQLIRVNLIEKPLGYHSQDKRPLERYRILRLGFPTAETQEELDMPLGVFLGQWGLTQDDFVGGPVYFQEIWEEVETSDDGSGKDERQYMRTDVIVPRAVGGTLLREIPITIYNSTKLGPRCEKPMLLDIAVVNISEYRNSADEEHGAHFTALPQPWIAGFKFKGDLFIGSGVAWQSEDAQARAGYLEFSGAGLRAIGDLRARKMKVMASLGGRLLEEQSPPGSQEAAETLKLRTSGERSVLVRSALMASEGLTRNLRLLRRFAGQGEEVGVKLNVDFGIDMLSPPMLSALMEQVQNGLMSWDTYVHNLRRGELYADQWTKEDEEAAILVGPPGRDLNTLLNPQIGDPTMGDPASNMDSSSSPTPAKPKPAKKKAPKKSKKPAATEASAAPAT